LARPRRNFRREEPKARHRINESIRIPKIRLVGDNLDAVSEVAGRTVDPGVYSTGQVQRWAQDLNLDLVEISPKADPPVCKIIDYKKFVYDQKKKEKEDDHDFNFKLRHAKKFLEEGAKVKAYVHFRGRTIVFKDRGELLLLRFLKELEEFGAAEALPKMEGRRMIVMISSKKKAKK